MINDPLLEEEVHEADSKYNLVQHDEDNIQISEEFIFDDKINKGIHSLKFNYNDQYLAAGKHQLEYRLSGRKSQNI